MSGATLVAMLADTDPGSLFSLEKLSLVTVMALGVIAFMRRWVVPGWLYDELKAENNRLRESNDKLKVIGQSATSTVEKIVANPPPSLSNVHDAQD